MPVEAPEYSGEYVVQFIKVLNRETETPVSDSIPLGLPYLH